MMQFKYKTKITYIVILFFITGCATSIPIEALQLSPQSLKLRQLQTRHYDTLDEEKILSSSAALLQDLGFNIDESETRLGLIVASKKRDATEAGQVVASLVLAVLVGAYVPVDSEQKIRASVVTRPTEGGNRMSVRVTFQRLVWDSSGNLSRAEALEDEKAYQEFFDKLSQSIFLEAHKI